MVTLTAQAGVNRRHVPLGRRDRRATPDRRFGPRGVLGVLSPVRGASARILPAADPRAGAGGGSRGGDLRGRAYLVPEVPSRQGARERVAFLDRASQALAQPAPRRGRESCSEASRHANSFIDDEELHRIDLLGCNDGEVTALLDSLPPDQQGRLCTSIKAPSVAAAGRGSPSHMRTGRPAATHWSARAQLPSARRSLDGSSSTSRAGQAQRGSPEDVVF